MGNELFITGATGFLGRNLLTELLKKYPQSIFYVLVRSKTSENKLKKLFPTSKISYLYGDLVLPEYNIDSSTIKQIIPNITQFWHVAASTSFDDRKKDEIITTNIEGTKNIIALAKKSKALECLYFVSTAYIAGNNQDIIYEDIMPSPNNGFKNCYEESKYLAEQLLRASNLPYTIFRPSIIMGDSVTGDHQQEIRMVYGYMLGIYCSIIGFYESKKEFAKNWINNTYKKIPLRLAVNENATKNYVCVDDVVNMILAIINADHINKTFNLTNENSLLVRDIVEIIGKVMKIKGIVCGNNNIDQMNRPTKVEKMTARYTKPFHRYTLYSEPNWDTTNTQKALGNYQRKKMTLELLMFLLDKFVKHEFVEKY